MNFEQHNLFKKTNLFFKESFEMLLLWQRNKFYRCDRNALKCSKALFLGCVEELEIVYLRIEMDNKFL